MFIVNKGNNKFFITDEKKEQIGVITYFSDDNRFVVDHTFVDPQYRNEGLARKLLDALVEYSRRQKKKIIPKCSYVLTTFKRNESEFEDVWEKQIK